MHQPLLYVLAKSASQFIPSLYSSSSLEQKKNDARPLIFFFTPITHWKKGYSARNNPSMYLCSLILSRCFLEQDSQYSLYVIAFIFFLYCFIFQSCLEGNVVVLEIFFWVQLSYYTLCFGSYCLLSSIDLDFEGEVWSCIYWKIGSWQRQELELSFGAKSFLFIIYIWVCVCVFVITLSTNSSYTSWMNYRWYFFLSLQPKT